jgi:hypothetical protein
MGKKHKKPPKKALEAINDFTLAQLIVSLEKQLEAKKTLFLTHKGVVVSSRTVVGHKVQLRAAIELAKLHGLYPRRGEREAGDRYDRSARPVINLVIAGPEARSTISGRPEPNVQRNATLR